MKNDKNRGTSKFTQTEASKRQTKKEQAQNKAGVPYHIQRAENTRPELESVLLISITKRGRDISYACGPDVTTEEIYGALTIFKQKIENDYYFEEHDED